jgi:PAS domain S-box-containing protein
MMRDPMADVPELSTSGLMIPDSASVDLLSAIVDNVAQPVFVMDRSQRLVLVNRALSELLGRPRAEMVGRNGAEAFSHADAGILVSTASRVFTTGRTEVIEEHAFKHASGDARHVRMVKAPLFGADGTVTHLVAVVVDVSEARAAEVRLRTANEELERAVEERTRALRDVQQALLRKERLTVLGQLAGGLAHQIRNPLAAMQTAAAILRRRLGDHGDPDIQQALTVIREEVWEANRIITDLLDYARVKPPAATVIAVDALIAAALEATPPPPRITAKHDVAPGVTVRVDERQVRDALGNVIRNAYEAMLQGGTLTISADVLPDEVVIVVEDTGPGLTRESIQRLFEPLVTTKPLGLGLGLSTARALIENQGGTIRCATSRGTGGARFELRLPAAPSPP